MSDTALPNGRERLADLDRAHVWHPFTAQADWAASEPLIIDRAEGCELIDTEGRRYLDGVGSLWCNLHGHRHPRLDRALRDQIDLVAHTTLLGLSHPTAILLAKALVDRAPAGLTRLFYSDDGATAVEVALKMAFQYWRQVEPSQPGRTKFVALTGAYHGDTLGDVALGNVDRFHALFAPLLFPVLRAPVPYCYRCPIGLERSSCGIACLDAVERLLANHPGEVAAVVIEPVLQGASGMIVHPEGYLTGIREITRRHDVLLIADEVATGFGRTGPMFASQREDVTPDFLCLAKALTAGYLPLAATLTTERVFAAFNGTAAENRTFQHGHTYGGNPLAAAVALESLAILDDEKTLDRTRELAAHLADRLRRLSEHPNVGEARSVGLAAGIELVADKASKAQFPRASFVGARVCREARDLGVMLRPLGDVIVIFPPLAITRPDLDRLLNAIETALDRVISAGLAPADVGPRDGALAEDAATPA
jgi:adenosylmethionine-8-amino-7-oxononanoate aminotransferase